jgi:hypothetical protein
MKALLNNERAPVTFGAGFIEISFSEYCDAFTSWWKQLEIDFKTSSFEAELKEAMLRLEPLQNPQNRYLITETRCRLALVQGLRLPRCRNTVFPEPYEARGEQDLHSELRSDIFHVGRPARNRMAEPNTPRVHEERRRALEIFSAWRSATV